MAFPFVYEDLMSENIKSLEAYNNRFDPTGRLNELRLPPKRKQQAAARPKIYNLEQHLTFPHLSAALRGPPTLSLDPLTSFPIQITLMHYANPAGNPYNKPVTFRLRNTALTEIDEADTYPWLLLLLLHDANGSDTRDVDDGNHGPAKPFDIDDDEEEERYRCMWMLSAGSRRLPSGRV